jgi:hypothetical protein
MMATETTKTNSEPAPSLNALYAHDVQAAEA